MVSEQPASMVLRVARGSRGLSPSQRAEALRFLGHFRGSDSGNSKLVIGVPSGTANETAAMYAVSDLRHLISELGFPDNTVVVEPYGAGRDSAAPIRLSYLRYVAEGPECGRWPTNLAEDYRNLPYPNFGCAQQRNLASQVANPADLLGPRTMDPADAERRAVVYDRYRQGQPTGAAKSEDERVQVRGAN
jgi:pilus assembly protein CpaD